MPNVSLTPEQQSYINERVASGRFSSASEVMRHALRLMQESEERRERLVSMLCDVSARADRDGTLSADEVDAELKAVSLRPRSALEPRPIAGRRAVHP